MQRARKRLSYANVVATVALFLALGGGAFAAVALPKNSVGTKQIKKGAVTAAKIRAHTITGHNVNLAALGTVPSATTAESAKVASALSPPEAINLVGATGEPPFLAGSANVGTLGALQFAPVGFYKDHEGVVHLEGIAKVGKEGPMPGLIFTLPAGDRPASGVAQAFVTGESTGVYILGSNVTVEGKDLSGDVFSPGSGGVAILSGITFRAQS